MENKRVALIEKQVSPLVLCEILPNKVALVTLNRPSKLNSLSRDLWKELNDILRQLTTNPLVHVVVLTGSGRAFAAGAEISEFMSVDMRKQVIDYNLNPWLETLPHFKKPIIAAVNGFALGGGCEVALMCDIIIASKSAKFSQPEIKLGLMPGAGGTQRLPRAIGKYNAMYMILTGEMVSAEEAQRLGLVSKVVDGDVVKEAIELAKKISQYSLPSLINAKDGVNAAFEGGLSSGVKKEIMLFGQCFGFADKDEGVNAFLNKRKPNFQNR